jgi:predicted cupin superfamily sugar epimerase
MTASDWIAHLGLSPHPEGGCFRETYRSPEQIPHAGLPPRFPGARAFSTAITFLLQNDDFSALHRIKADEVWHFYAGSTLRITVIDPAGALSHILLGADPSAGATPQAVVPAGCWFGASLIDKTSFALVGCTVAPGFDFADFEMGERETLLAAFPQHRDAIIGLTR